MSWQALGVIQPFSASLPSIANRFAAAQLWFAATGNQLLRLHKKLDFADTAPPKLHIVAKHRDFAMALVGMDLPLDRMHIGDGGVSQDICAR